jgi:hypothetical protein
VGGKERWELVSTSRRTSFGVKSIRFFQILAKLHCLIEGPTKFASYTRLAIMGRFSGSKCDELVHVGKWVATRTHKFHGTLVMWLNEIHFRQIYIKFYYSRVLRLKARGPPMIPLRFNRPKERSGYPSQ